MQLRELDPQYDSESDNKEDEEPEEIEESQSIEEPGRNLITFLHPENSHRGLQQYDKGQVVSEIIVLRSKIRFIEKPMEAECDQVIYETMTKLITMS